MDYDHIKIKISCEMKNGYVWEIGTRILFILHYVLHWCL